MNLNHLNASQRDAVQIKNKNAFILAGAGTGKTSVLTHRICFLLDTNQANLNEIMALTFTNKAAKEMKTRLSKMLDSPLNQAWIGTFHGICHRILRTHYKIAGFSQQFTILDEGDQLGVIKRAMLSIDLDPKKDDAKEIQAFINHQKEVGCRARNYKSKDTKTRKFKSVYEAYEQRCQQESVIDFAELLLRVYELWQEHPDFKEKFNQQFKFVLVDEFQDTSTLQYKWLKLLVSDQQHIFAVGDDDQSIFSWRGAVVKNIQSLIDDYQAIVVKLEQNYRSTDAVLHLANTIIDTNTDRLGKRLHTSKTATELPLIKGFADQNEEAEYVCDRIKELHRSGIEYSQMAVIYRASALSRPFEHKFNLGRIPYVVYGGTRFYERQEVKHALAYLKLMAAPNDDGALMRVINIPPRGIGATSVEKLQKTAKEMGQSMFETIDLAKMSGKAKSGVEELKAVVLKLQEEKQTSKPLGQKLKTLLEETGLIEWYKEQIEAGKEHEDRLENLEELVNAAVGFEREFPQGTMEDFLSITALESSSNKPEKDKNETVSIMTVHASKGLEFECVFIVGLEEGVFPNSRCMEEDLIEEERRLMYVAVTRAKKWLTLCVCAQRMKYGEMISSPPSSFLTEITNLTKLCDFYGQSSVRKGLGF